VADYPEVYSSIEIRHIREEAMPNDRREFMKVAGATAAVVGATLAAAPTMAQVATPGQFRAIKALAFDAYGTLFDVFSVTNRALIPEEDSPSTTSSTASA
jgi:hypothetical protein